MEHSYSRPTSTSKALVFSKQNGFSNKLILTLSVDGRAGGTYNKGV